MFKTNAAQPRLIRNLFASVGVSMIFSNMQNHLHWRYGSVCLDEPLTSCVLSKEKGRHPYVLGTNAAKPRLVHNLFAGRGVRVILSSMQHHLHWRYGSVCLSDPLT